MPSVKVNLNLGDGLELDSNNKITVKYDVDSTNIRLFTSGTENEKGLYIDPLTANGGSVPDNWSMIPGQGTLKSDTSVKINNFIDMNREVVNLIFTFGLYTAGGRNATTIAYTSTVKTVQDICNEIDIPLVFHPSNWTSFRPNKGELIQLVIGATARSVNYLNTVDKRAVEDGNRIGNDVQTTKVMLLITNIQYKSDIEPQGNAYWVTSMDVVCLYSEVPEYVVGQTYHGETSIN